MEHIDNYQENIQWQRKRKHTFICICIIAFGLGLEYSLVFPSLWFYYNDIIKANYAKVLYGSALSAYPLASIIGSFAIGRYVDRTRKTRFVLMCLLMLEILGNIIYTLYYFEWAPLLGRFLSGFGDVCYMVMGGEIARSYEENEITKHISYMVACFSIGFIIAPSANILFDEFYYNFYGFEITFGNIPGIIMFCIFTLIFVCTMCFVHDLSREFDLKNFLQLKKAADLKSTSPDSPSNSTMTLQDLANIEGEQSNLIDSFLDAETEESPKEETGDKSFLDILKKILSCPDLVLLLAFCFVSSYVLFSFDTLLSLIVSHYFGFGVKETSIIFICNGAVYSCVLLLFARVSRRFADYHVIVFAFCILIIGLLALFTLTLYHENKSFNYFLFMLYLIGFCISWTIEEVLTRSLFAKLVPSWCQSYAEGIRRSFSSVAFIAGGITSSSLFDYLTYLTAVLVAVSSILLVFFLKRSKNLIASKPLF